MKKSINILGYIALVLIIASLAFKLGRWSGAGFMLSLSTAFLSLVYLPAFMIRKMREFADRKTKAMIAFGFICTSFFVLGEMFKIMHWPGAGPLIVFSSFVFCCTFLPLYLSYKNAGLNSKIERAMNLSLVLFFGFFIAALVFKIQHWPYADKLAGTWMLILFFAYFPLFMLVNKDVPEKINNSFSQLIFVFIPLFIIMALMSTSGNSVYSVFQVIEGQVSENTSRLRLRNQMLLTELEANKKGAVAVKVTRVKELANDLDNYIKEMKSNLIMHADRIEKSQADSTPVANIMSKDNIDIANAILIGDEPARPRVGNLSARELKNKLIAYKIGLLSLIEDSAKKLILDKQMGLEIKDLQDGEYNTWETNNFYRFSLAPIITILSQLQYDVRYAEAEVLGSLQTQTIKK